MCSDRAASPSSTVTSSAAAASDRSRRARPASTLPVPKTISRASQANDTITRAPGHDSDSESSGDDVGTTTIRRACRSVCSESNSWRITRHCCGSAPASTSRNPHGTAGAPTATASPTNTPGLMADTTGPGLMSNRTAFRYPSRALSQTSPGAPTQCVVACSDRAGCRISAECFIQSRDAACS